MSRRRLQMVLVAGLVMLLGAVGVAVAGGGGGDIRERLTGYEEVPAVSTEADGKFQARISRFSDRIDFRLSYEDLEGPVLFAHIHFGQESVNGGVSAFLCGGGGKPACPQSGTVEGTIVPADIVGPAAQGIAAGEFDELVDAIRAGVTYANVHSEKFPGGEIRAQLDGDHRGRGRGHDDDHDD